MNYAIKFRPEIEEDALNAYYWYEEKAVGLGEDFFRVFYASITEIQRNPFSHNKVYKNFRRKLTRRFPYSIYYIVQDNIIIVFGLFHTARHPRRIKSKLNSR